MPVVRRFRNLIGLLVAASLTPHGHGCSPVSHPQDRLANLIQAAKREGTLVLYGSMPTEDQTRLVQAFEMRYGIKVQTWRSSSEQVVQRAIMESKAGKQGFDLVETNLDALAQLHAASALRPLEDLAVPTDLLPPHRHWVETRYSLYVCAFNTRLVTPNEVPKTYSELTAPRWRHRIAFEVDDSAWYGTLCNTLGDKEARRIFDAIAANGILVRKGHSLMVNLISAGELPLSPATYGYRVAQLMRTGAPVGYQVLAPTLVNPAGIGMARTTARPNAANLFVHFMMTEGQRILADRDHVPAIPQTGKEPFDRTRFVRVGTHLRVEPKEQAWRTLYENFLHRGMAANPGLLRLP